MYASEWKRRWSSCPLVLILSGAAFIIAFNGVEVQGDGGHIQCYVCSWQKPSRNFSVVDNCTHHHFQEGYASIVNCSRGCEAVTHRHAKNEEIYHFSRNCLNSKKDDGVDKCFNIEDNKFEYLSRCECHSDLCNGAASPQMMGSRRGWTGIVGTIILIILMSNSFT